MSGNTALMRSNTRIAVQVIVEDDTGDVATLIMTLSVLIAVMARAGRVISDIVQFAGDVADSVYFTATVFEIGFVSLAWGLGVIK